MESRKRYPTDLTDAEWQQVEHLIPQHRSGGPGGGRPPKYDLREVLNAIFYITKAGCIWRMMPHDLPPWETVYGYFAQWRDAGVFERMNEVLRRKIRVEECRDPEPSAAIMDSQSVKTAEKGGATKR
jgi:putative transposase